MRNNKLLHQVQQDFSEYMGQKAQASVYEGMSAQS